MNHDGKVSLVDVIWLRKTTAGTLQLNTRQLIAAQCCADDRLNASDATALLEYLIGNLKQLPVVPE